MAEEFEESEVIFQENVEHEDSDDACSNFNRPSSGNSKRKKIMKPNSTRRNLAAAAPVSIPENVSWLRYIDRSDFIAGDDEEGEMVPPHIIVGRRRVAGKMMAFSVCTGNGRTLKGRDLSRVRNSVLRMTGFLET